MNKLDEEDSNRHWMYYVELSLGIISIIGSFFIILVFLLHKKLRNFPFELVVYLTIASSINTLSYLIHYVDRENTIIFDLALCKTQAFLMIWFEISQMIWVNLISYSVYRNVIHLEEDSQNEISIGKRIKYLSIGFIFPLVFPVIGLSFNLLGPSGRWCWISPDSQSTWSFTYGLVTYISIWVLILVNLIFTFVIIRYLNKTYNNPVEKQQIRKFITKLILYPVIQIICILPATVNRLIHAITGHFDHIVELISIIFISSQGLAYAITYGYNPQVRSALLESFGKLCCRKMRKVNIVVPDMHHSFISSNSEDSSFNKNDDSNLGLNPNHSKTWISSYNL